MKSAFSFDGCPKGSKSLLNSLWWAILWHISIGSNSHSIWNLSHSIWKCSSKQNYNPPLVENICEIKLVNNYSGRRLRSNNYQMVHKRIRSRSCNQFFPFSQCSYCLNVLNLSIKPSFHSSKHRWLFLKALSLNALNFKCIIENRGVILPLSVDIYVCHLRNRETKSQIIFFYLLFVSIVHRWHRKPDSVCCWKLRYPLKLREVKDQDKVCLSKIFKVIQICKTEWEGLLDIFNSQRNQWNLSYRLVCQVLPAKVSLVLSAPPSPLSLATRHQTQYFL